MTLDRQAILNAPPRQVYKADRRSRVWEVEVDGQRLVVKRYEHSPLRQAAGWLLGIHPGQREARQIARLARAGLPVVPALDRWVERRGPGLWMLLAFPWQGDSLLRQTRHGPLTDPARRREAIAALADVVAALLTAGFVHRDLRSSNLLRGEDGRLWMIDVGAARRWRTRGQLLRMLATLDAAARRDGASAADRARFLRLLARRAPGLGAWRSLAAALSGRSC